MKHGNAADQDRPAGDAAGQRLLRRKVLSKVKTVVAGSRDKSIRRAGLTQFWPISAKPAFALYHTDRSGSSVLTSMLNQQGDLKRGYEVFNKDLQFYQDGALIADPLSILRSLRLRAFPKATVAEFRFHETMDPLELDLSLEDYVALVQRAGYRHSIVLERRNTLRQVLSWKLQQKRTSDETRKNWNYSDPSMIPPATVRLDPAAVELQGRTYSLLDLLESYPRQYAALRAALAAAGQASLELTYEDDIEQDPMVAYRKFCAWAKVPARGVEVGMVRINDKPLPAMIENYDEVAATLSGTPYEWMLN